MQTSLTRDRKAPTVTPFADRRAEVINDVMVFSIMSTLWCILLYSHTSDKPETCIVP